LSFSLFTPRHKTTVWDNCYQVIPGVRAESEFFFLDFVDCNVDATNDVMIYLFGGLEFIFIFYLFYLFWFIILFYFILKN